MNCEGSEISCCHSMMRAQPRLLVACRPPLVRPVRRHAPLGALVHLVGADLDLDRLAPARSRWCATLVEVELGHGDVVLEPPLHRAPATHGSSPARRSSPSSSRPSRGCDEVEDLVELATLHHHLLVDATTGASAAVDLGQMPSSSRRALDFGEHLRKVDVTLGRPLLHQVVEFGEPLRMQGGEARSSNCCFISCMPSRWARGA
jgi:hypothetical protein